MDPALIAVVGTLTGVAFSATAGIIAVLLISRHQRALSHVQAEHEMQQAARRERRSAFIEYLQAYDDAFTRADRLSKMPASGSSWIEIANEEMGRLKRAYLVLTISAGAPVRTAADDCLGAIWDLGESAASGALDEYAQAASDSREPRERLRSAMRAELGIEDAGSEIWRR